MKIPYFKFFIILAKMGYDKTMIEISHFSRISRNNGIDGTQKTS